MKRKLITITSIVLVLSLMALVYFTTSVPPVSGASAMLEQYTRNKPNAKVTVAVIRGDDEEIYAVGHDGKAIDVPDGQYNIAGITKSFTGLIAARAVTEEKLSLGSTARDYIGIAAGSYSPSVSELVTNTSAYGDYVPTALNSIASSVKTNTYTGFDASDVIYAMNDFRLNMQPPYFYSDSDFGASVLGMILADIYQQSYVELLESFAIDEFGLEDTYVPEGLWKTDDAYIAAYGLSSSVDDMVKYARVFLGSRSGYLAAAVAPMREVNVENSVGYMWNITDGSVLSTGGSTGYSGAHMIIDPEHSLAVIVLSNYGSDKYGSVSDIAWAIYSEEISG